VLDKNLSGDLLQLCQRLFLPRRLQAAAHCIGTRKESAYGAQARTIAAELAVHFGRGHDPQRAVHYLRSAGENAMQWCACKEAVAYFEQALGALRHLPAHREVQEQAIDLRFALRNALLPLAEHHRILTLLREAEPLAETLDDTARLGRVYIYQEHSLVLFGADDEALEAIERAHTLAAASGDSALQIMAAARLGVLYRMHTDYQQGITIPDRFWNCCKVCSLTSVLAA